MKTVSIVLTVLAVLTLSASLDAQEAYPGIFRSVDGGHTWESSAAGFPTKGLVTAFLQDEAYLFAASNDHGLFRSDDNGSSWVKKGDGLPDKIKALAARKDVLFAAPWRAGIYVSMNHGATWHERSFGLDDRDVSAIFVLGDVVFVGTGTGIFYTWNDGQTWNRVYQGAQINDFVQVGMQIFAATAKGILYSSDFGRQWTPILTNGGVFDLFTCEYGLFGLTYRDGVLKSVMADSTWEACNNGLPELHHNTFALSFSNGQLLAGQWDGLYVSTTRGLHWTKQETNLPEGAIAMKLLTLEADVLLAGIYYQPDN